MKAFAHITEVYEAKLKYSGRVKLFLLSLQLTYKPDKPVIIAHMIMTMAMIWGNF